MYGQVIKLIKKFIAFLTAAFLCLPALHPVSAEETLSVSARAAVLMDASTGRILFSVNPDEKLAMASTTKIMTALLALEEAEKETLAQEDDPPDGPAGDAGGSQSDGAAAVQDAAAHELM